MAEEWNGRVAVVTGGGSGIGAALCRLIAERGGRVVVSDVDRAAAEAVADDIGGNAIAVRCDVRDTDQIDLLAERAFTELGNVDAVFANAGVAPAGPLLMASPEEFDFIYEVNMRGAWATCAIFARRMIAAQNAGTGRGGAICVTASEHSFAMQHAGSGFYTASKHAALGWADVLRRELPEGMTMHLLCPGITQTELYDSRRGTELPDPHPATKEYARLVMRRGMDPRAVAQIALAGIAAGAFIIPTHTTSLNAAEWRWKEINAAFNRYAPPGSASEVYDTLKIMGEVAADFGRKRG